MSKQTTDRIVTGRVGVVHYTLSRDSGEVIDSSRGGVPLAYLHGAGAIPAGLERSLDGRRVGQTFQVTVSPADGYGERRGPGPQPLPRDAFPADFHVEEGARFAAEDDDGSPITLWVVRIDRDLIYVDINHPLAGVMLRFDVEVVGVRDPTEQEIVHGHAHGPDGANHGEP